MMLKMCSYYYSSDWIHPARMSFYKTLPKINILYED